MHFFMSLKVHYFEHIVYPRINVVNFFRGYIEKRLFEEFPYREVELGPRDHLAGEGYRRPGRDMYPAFFRLPLAGDEGKDSALAGAILPHYGDLHPPAHGKIYRVENRLVVS